LLSHVGLLASVWSSSESVHEGLKLLLHLLELLLLLLRLLLLLLSLLQLLLLECVESRLPVGCLLSAASSSIWDSICVYVVSHLVDKLLESIPQLLISSTWSSTLGEVKGEQFDE
jgi:hypothetical protein